MGNSSSQFNISYDTIFKKNETEHYTLRFLKRDDYKKGYRQTLEQHFKANKLPDSDKLVKEEDFHRLFDSLESCAYFNRVIVVENRTATVDEDRVVAVARLVIRPSFLDKNGLVAHVEELALNLTKAPIEEKNNQKTPVPSKLIQPLLDTLKDIAAATSCHKITLSDRYGGDYIKSKEVTGFEGKLIHADFLPKISAQ